MTATACLVFFLGFVTTRLGIFRQSTTFAQTPTFAITGISADCNGTGQVTFTGIIPDDGIVLTLYDKHGGNGTQFVPADPLIFKTIPFGSTSPASYTLDLATWTGGPHYRVDSNFETKSASLYCTGTEKASPTIYTTPSAGGVVGIQIYDTATVSGGSDPSGTVTFNLYDTNDSTCSNTPVFTDVEVPLINGSSTSAGYTTLMAGTYHWIATYNGDSNNNPVTDNCSNEAVTIDKASPTLSTTIHDPEHNPITSVDAGSTVHDSATISGGYNPTGNVDFTFYPNSSCTEDAGSSAGIVTLSDGTAHPSDSEGPLNAGTYSFIAHYEGNDNNNPADSLCELLTVNQITPDISTQIHLANESIVSGPVALGSTVHDQATSSGAFGIPTGSVDFTFYTSGDCSTGNTSAGTVVLSSGIAHPSNSRGPLSTGSYSFKAHYNGDINYLSGDSSCENLTVNQATPTISTELHNFDNSIITTDASTSTVYDKATVAGIGVTGLEPSGNVDFSFFTNGACTPTGSSAGSIPLDNKDPGTAISSSEGPLSNGLFSFIAHYVGDNNYTAGDSACEPFSLTTLTVNKVLLPSTDGGLFDLQIDGSTKITDVSDRGTTGAVIVTAGKHAAGEVAGTNTALSNYSPTIAGDCASDGSVTLIAGDAKSCTITNTRYGSITIIKDAQPNDIESFSFSGGALGPFSLIDDGSSLNTKVFNKLLPGSFTIGETEPNVFWVPNGISCIDNDTSLSYANTTYSTLSATINLTAGKNITCTFANKKLSPSRTLGFWQTHTSFTSFIFNEHPFYIGVNLSPATNIHKGTITNTPSAGLSQLFGAFYSSIPKTSTGAKRNSVDQSRMTLLQQLVAAKLNCAAFGCPSNIQLIISQADAAYSSGLGIQPFISALDSYNNSGDTLTIPNVGSATPKTSQSYANISFWNTP